MSDLVSLKPEKLLDQLRVAISADGNTQLLYGCGLRLYDIRSAQELLEHKDAKATMIYTRALNRGPMAVRSPLDQDNSS